MTLADFMTAREKALGREVATELRWDGAAIMRVFAAALTDANFHDEAERILRQAERL